MEKKITYREFQKQDAAYVADIIKETWNYDRLTTPKIAKKLSFETDWLSSLYLFVKRRAKSYENLRKRQPYR